MDYSTQIWERFRAPRYAGALSGSSVLTGEARTPASQAVLRLYLHLGPDGVEQARFQAYGCPSVIASADWLCEWLEGRSPAEARALSSLCIAEALDLMPTRRHCAVLAEDALMAALSKAQNDPAVRMSDEDEVIR
jgi:NifU-like protein involved in Fe-S cluster formation